VRGSSALQQVFEKRPTLKVEVLAVWLPVVATDIAPPTKRVLARLSDARVKQFWDPKHYLSDAIKSASAADPKWVRPEDRELYGGDDVVWDFVAVFPIGARWEKMIPPPDFYGFPVVEAIDGLEKRLSAGGS
jgi:hypothetical protein